MEGQILGNRYELIEKIGGGGMALVYKARCTLLNRFVAVKILRQDFINDEEFVKRFRIEAQSAASLSHPNIVSIYDVGHEGNIHYIVMEYIDGVTLKDYISKKGALLWKEAVNIAIQICSAIEHAHRNHIVHRDIKPHNILLTSEGIAKVTDFGIARAVSSSTITMVGSTIGSVHYFSPEQARGGYTDEKSDLYSLGIVLYEMVTGRLPYNGDTPVSIALKHIQDEAKQPIELNEEIPRGVNSIIMTAIQKEQSCRFQTSNEMLDCLYKVLKTPDEEVATSDEIDSCETKRVPVVNETNHRLPREDKPVVSEKESKEKKKDRVSLWVAIGVSAVIMIVFGILMYKLVLPSWDNDVFTVDDYVGRNYFEVKGELKAKNIEVKEIRKYHDTEPKDTILAQDKTKGEKIKLGGYNNIIEFEVSDGQKMIKIPPLKNLESRTAEAQLAALDLEPRVVEEFNENIAVGYVIRTEPGAEDEVKVRAPVTIFVSKGIEQIMTKVPDLIGKTKLEAYSLISGAKLSIGKIEPGNETNVVDKIIDQNPKPNTQVPEDTKVDLVFQKEEKPVSVKKTVKEKITLAEPEMYGDVINVVIEAVPSDTNKVEMIMNEDRNKTDFPVSYQVLVPNGGSTQVRIYLDNVLYKDITFE